MKKTLNLNLTLLANYMAAKETVVNEALVTMDSLYTNSVKAIVDNLPENSVNGQKFIINNPQSDYHNHIIYMLDGPRYISPYQGQMLYNENTESYIAFRDGKWHKLYLNFIMEN